VDATALLAKSFDLDGATDTIADRWEIENAAEIYRMESQAENAWLRHAENAGWMEAEAERQWEDSRGVIQFDEALAAALGRR
jgi:uncharacterized membrane protein